MAVLTLVHAVLQAAIGFVVLGFLVALWVRADAATSLLASRDARLARIETTLADIQGHIGLNHASAARIEAAAAVVAADLRESHLRADATDGQAGEQADAAARSAPYGRRLGDG